MFGRESHVASLLSWVREERRLITLVGPAGVGKTRLSLALAWRLEETPWFTGQLAYCDLSEASTADDLSACVVHALDIKGARAGGEERTRRVGRHLASRGPLLLFLDNFEQLAEAAALTLSQWLRSAKQTRLVVTSRVRLRLEAEHVFPVNPLPREDAAALFIHRVKRVRPAFVVGPDEADLLGDVLDGLDNLPLAIELAAARMHLMGLSELRGRLNERLQLLTSRRRDGASRQSSLSAALAGSWNQLTPAERTALTQCTHFRGGFDLAAAAAVIALDAHPDAPAPLDVVQALVDQSMLSAHDLALPLKGRRLSMLRSIRDFVSAQPSTDGAEATSGAVRRHARYYVRESERLGDAWQAGDPEALLRLRLERDNLLAAAKHPETEPPIALRAALALDPVVGTWGAFEAHLDLLRGCFVAAEAEGLEDLDLARALVGLGRFEITTVGVAQAEKSWARAASLAAGHAELEGRAHHGLAVAAHASGELDEAERIYEVALRRLREPGVRRRALAIGLFDHAILHFERGSLGAALEAVEEAAAVVGQGQGPMDDLAGAVLVLRGCVHLERGVYEEARAAYEAGLDVARRGQYKVLEGQALGELAALAMLEGSPENVRRAFETATVVVDEIGDRRMQCDLAGYRALAAHLLDGPEPAGRRYEQARRLARDLGRERFLGCLGAWSAMAFADEDRTQACLERIADLDEVEDGDRVVAGTVDFARAQLELARARQAGRAGRLPDAISRFRAARSMASPTRHRSSTGDLLEDTSRDLRLTRRLFERALQATAEELGKPELSGEERVRITVDGAGRWFRVDQSSTASTGRRQAVRRLLLTLATRHLSSPGEPVARDELISAIWPGERMLAQSAKNRLHVALSQLRKLGMREHILTKEDGYLLDPRIDLSLARQEEGHRASEPPANPELSGSPTNEA